jgi:hypothetical protein
MVQRIGLYLVFLLVVYLLSIADGQDDRYRRWYYTNKFKNNQPVEGILFFNGSSFEYEDLFSPMKSPILFGGNMVLSLEEDQNSIFTADSVKSVLSNVTNLFYEDGKDVLESINSQQYNIFVINNYVSASNANNISDLPVMEEEIGLYDHRLGSYVERRFRQVRVGIVLAVNFAISLDSEPSLKTSHRVLITLDMIGKASILFHSFNSSDDMNNAIKTAEDRNLIIQESVSGDGVFLPLPSGSDDRPNFIRVMTYNLWHNNPPSWIYHVKRLVLMKSNNCPIKH